MLSAINGMTLDMLADVAWKDYEDRGRRQLDGIERARKADKYKEMPKNVELHRNIAALLRDKYTISEVVNTLQCPNKTVIAVKKELENQGSQEA